MIIVFNTVFAICLERDLRADLGTRLEREDWIALERERFLMSVLRTRFAALRDLDLDFAIYT